MNYGYFMVVQENYLKLLVSFGQYICFTWIVFSWLASFNLTFNSTLLMSYFNTDKF